MKTRMDIRENKSAAQWPPSSALLGGAARSAPATSRCQAAPSAAPAAPRENRAPVTPVRSPAALPDRILRWEETLALMVSTSTAGAPPRGPRGSRAAGDPPRSPRGPSIAGAGAPPAAAARPRPRRGSGSGTSGRGADLRGACEGAAARAGPGAGRTAATASRGARPSRRHLLSRPPGVRLGPGESAEREEGGRREDAGVGWRRTRARSGQEPGTGGRGREASGRRAREDAGCGAGRSPFGPVPSSPLLAPPLPRPLRRAPPSPRPWAPGGQS